MSILLASWLHMILCHLSRIYICLYLYLHTYMKAFPSFSTYVYIYVSVYACLKRSSGTMCPRRKMVYLELEASPAALCTCTYCICCLAMSAVSQTCLQKESAHFLNGTHSCTAASTLMLVPTLQVDISTVGGLSLLSLPDQPH